MFDLRGSLLTLLDSDSRRRQDDRAILIAEGKANTDPVLEEIIGLFTILLYYLSPLLFTVLLSYFREMYALIWKSNSFTVELTKWQTMIDTTLPQQITRTDCAVFSAMFALFNAYEMPFSLFKQDFNYWRRKLACDLLYDKFHGTTLQAKV